MMLHFSVVCDRDDIVCFRYDISACVVCCIYVFFCDRDDIVCYRYDISACVFLLHFCVFFATGMTLFATDMTFLLVFFAAFMCCL